MKLKEMLLLNFYAYRHKFLIFWAVTFIAPIIILGWFKDVQNIDFYIYAILVVAFLMFSLFEGMYHFSKLSKCYLNSKVDRKNYLIGSLILLVVQAILQTLLLSIYVLIMHNYYRNNSLVVSDYPFFSFNSIAIFFLLDILIFVAGSFISLFFKRFNIVIYGAVIILILFFVLKDIDVKGFIYHMFETIFINRILGSYLIVIGSTLILSVLNHFKFCFFDSR